MNNRIETLFWVMVAALLRGLDAFYALEQVCLTPAAEQPLAAGQSFSVLAHSLNDTHALRWLGMLAGALTVALTAASARQLGARWHNAAAALVAVAPPLVWVDRWTLASDGALLCTAAGIWAWLVWRAAPHKAWAHALLLASATGLLLCAPMLWWLLVGAWLWARLSWHDAAFVGSITAVLVALTRQPFNWLAQVSAWDEGATAVLLWLLLASALYRLPTLPSILQRALGIVTSALFISTVLMLVQLPRPMLHEWVVINALQNYVADDSVVLFDRATAHLAPFVACPLGTNLRMTWYMQGAFLPSHIKPDYSVFSYPAYSETLHSQALLSDYTLVRHISVPNPIVLPFGDQVLLLGYQLATRNARAGDLLDLRLDWQFTGKLDAQATVYAGFVHVTLPNQPTEKTFELNYPLIAEMGSLRPRSYNLNQHLRFALPHTTPHGTYDVIFGVYDTMARRELGRIKVAELRVGEE